MRRTETNSGRGDAERPLGSKLAWFVGLWLAGVAVIGLVAFVIRTWIGA